MKRAYRIILGLFLFIIPFFVSASVRVVFDDAKWSSNTYITQFNGYRWYIDFNTKKKYVYDGNTFSELSGFTNGGLINVSEYNISLRDNKSYLKNAREYWTMTKDGNNFYTLNNGNVVSKNKNESLGVRPTEYILPKTEVIGQGSFADPWVFVKPNFYVDIEYNSPQIYRDNQLLVGGTAEYGDTIHYKLNLKNNGVRDTEVNIREIAMISALEKIVRLKESSAKIDGVISDEALEAVKKLLSDEGYTFTVAPGQEMEIEFDVIIIGNAGEVVNNQILYVMDGMEAEPGIKNTVNVEKTVKYNEVSENGSNIVVILDTSGSMSVDTNRRDVTRQKLIPMRNAVNDFIDIFLVEQFNGSNEICIVVMADYEYNNSEVMCSQDAQTLKDFVNTTNKKGWTFYGKSLKDSYTQINNLKSKHVINTNSVIFFTDGEPIISSNFWGYVYENKSSYLAEANKVKTIAELYAIGFYTDNSSNNRLIQMVGNDNYYKAGKDDLGDVFNDISRRINEKSKITTRGVLAISRNIDKTKPLTVYVNDLNGKETRTDISYEDAIKEQYIISKGNRYEINIKKFKAYEKISVTYYLELK